MSVAQPVLTLEHGHEVHVPGWIAAANQGLPMADGLAVRLLDRGELGGGAFDRGVGHAPMKVGASNEVKRCRQKTVEQTPHFIYRLRYIIRNNSQDHKGVSRTMPSKPGTTPAGSSADKRL
jgi:hypothetical protein